MVTATNRRFVSSRGSSPTASPVASQDALVQTILHGRPGTPMPPWQPFVSEAEARWIVDRLLEGFPNE
jgi:cytochrome c55X